MNAVNAGDCKPPAWHREMATECVSLDKSAIILTIFTRSRLISAIRYCFRARDTCVCASVCQNGPIYFQQRLKCANSGGGSACCAVPCTVDILVSVYAEAVLWHFVVTLKVKTARPLKQHKSATPLYYSYTMSKPSKDSGVLRLFLIAYDAMCVFGFVHSCYVWRNKSDCRIILGTNENWKWNSALCVILVKTSGSPEQGRSHVLSPLSSPPRTPFNSSVATFWLTTKGYRAWSISQQWQQSTLAGSKQTERSS